MMAGSLFFRTGIMNNELLFKAPAVLYPFLSLLFLRALRRGDVKYRALLILYLVFSALPNLQCIMEKRKHSPPGRASCGNIGKRPAARLTARAPSSAASS